MRLASVIAAAGGSGRFVVDAAIVAVAKANFTTPS
jgi:hypothetical protein